MTLAEMLSHLDYLIQDDSDLLDNDARSAFLQEAVREYSNDRPYLLVQKYDGDGNYDYTLPTSWENDFSYFTSLEYPSGEQVPTMLEADEYGVYDNGTTRKLRFYQHTPGASEDFLVNYATRHTLTSSTNTIPVKDHYAVVSLAGALCCMALARKLAQSAKGKDINLEDSAWIWRSVNRYRELGKDLMEKYGKVIGGSPPAVSSGKQLVVVPSWGSFFNRSV